MREGGERERGEGGEREGGERERKGGEREREGRGREVREVQGREHHMPLVFSVHRR